ncbi:MAG TPA: hypothetical protein VFO25_00100 [Candidatus Eremiobacteraceae bacterium]|nr:hypothetical protein [Candidatus Eremiobacteraceae bacterium]
MFGRRRIGSIAAVVFFIGGVLSASVRPAEAQPYLGTVKAINGDYYGVQAITYDPIKKHIFAQYLQSGEWVVARITQAGIATPLVVLPFSVFDLAFDSQTGKVYAGYGCEIIQISAANGATTVLAGSTTCGTADGKGPLAQFQKPNGIAVDGTNGDLYVADSDRVRKVTPHGVVTTLTAPGSIGGGNCQPFNRGFQGVAYDALDGNLYVADSCPNIIRRVTVTTGQVTNAYGQCFLDQFFDCEALSRDGTGTSALFASPSGIVYSAIDQALYVADALNNQIRRISPQGVVTTLAGSGHAEFANGIGNLASFDEPDGVAASANGVLYVADTINQSIRTVASTGPTPPPPPHSFRLMDVPDIGAHPYGITFSTDGSLWYTETDFAKVLKIDTTGMQHSFTLPSGSFPQDIVGDASGNVWFDIGLGPPPFSPTPSIGVIRSDGTMNTYSVPGGVDVTSMTLGPDGNIWFVASNVDLLGFITGTGTVTEFTVDPANYISGGLSGDIWTTGTGFIERFSTSGTLLKKYVTNQFQISEFNPIAPGPVDRMWFAQAVDVGEVLKSTVATFQLPPQPQPFGWDPQGVVEGSDRAVWFTSGSSGDLGRMTSTGVFKALEIPAPRSSPTRIVLAPDGSLWFVDFGASKIGRWF